jgi:hypothetical protein
LDENYNQLKSAMQNRFDFNNENQHPLYFVLLVGAHAQLPSPRRLFFIFLEGLGLGW